MLYKALLEIILILNVGCLFEKATFIKSISDVNELHKKLISEGKKSLILIYSDSCPHCRRFESHYIKLSEIYHSGFDFYALSSKTNYKNKFKIRGVPTMFIFDGSDYIQHKGSNNFETISYILENDYSKKCREIDLEYLNKINSDLKENDEKKDHNFILGYFPNENIIMNKEGNQQIQKLIIKNAFENFINNTNQILSLVDNCYYIRNFNNEEDQDLDDEMIEGTVILFSENKGINKFTEYHNFFIDNQEENEDYYNKRIKDIGILYQKFLNNKIIDYYIDITDSKMANQLRLFIKRNVLLFVYKNEEQKNNFKKQISILFGMTKNEKYPLFDFVLFKYGCNLYSLSYYIKDSGIYFVDKNLNKISKKIDLDIIINLINTQNEYEFNPEEDYNEEKIETNIKNGTINKTKDIHEEKNEENYYENIRKNIIDKQLKNYLDNQKEEESFDYNHINSVICFIICLIMYSFIFDFIYQRLYPGKSIFHIFNDCIYFIKIGICDNDDDDDNIEIEQVNIKNKIKIINDEEKNIIRVNSNK